MIFTANDRDLAATLFKSVADATRAPGGGVCRPSYGRNESTAWKIIADTATRHDLYALPDAAANLVITAGTPLIPPKAVWIGSHLDSVPHGGNYDGLAGVVAALLMVTKARETKGRVPIVGLGLRGEESAWFGVPYLGSKALLGQLRHRDLDRSRRPEDENEHQLPTLAEALEQLGARPRQLVQTPIFPPGEIGEFWELHIEQGPVLVAKHKPIGVVTGIRGNVRAPSARIMGKAGHSGTTPHDLRDDAVVKFAELVTKLEARRRILTETFSVAAQRRWVQDLVFTCGIVSTNPKKHSITTIADEITFALDVRSLDDQTTKDFVTYAESLDVCLGETVETRSARIAPEMWNRAKRACEDLAVDHEVMPSGAGHDAAVFQQAGVPSGMIFIRNENGSHNPDEGMNLDDFMLGCEVLWRTITEGRL